MAVETDVLKIEIVAEDKATKVLEQAKQHVRELEAEFNKTSVGLNKVMETIASVTTKMKEATDRGDIHMANRYKYYLGKLKGIQKYRETQYKQSSELYAPVAPLLTDTLKSAKFDAQTGVLKATVQKIVNGMIQESTYSIINGVELLENQTIRPNENIKQANKAKKEKEAFRYKNPVKWGLGEAWNWTKSFGGAILNDTFEKIIDAPIFNGFFKTEQGKGLVQGFKNIGKGICESIKELKPGKLLKSFGRIALYRTIRAILSGIVNSFKEGFELIKSTNVEAKEGLFTIQSAFNTIKASVASIAMPLVQSIIPLLTDASSQIMGTANALSILNAQQNGESKAWVVSKEKVDDYTKSLQALSGQITQLDKFATLSKGNAIIGEYIDIDSEEATQILDDYEEKVKDIKGLIEDLSTMLKDLDFQDVIEIAKGLVLVLLAISGAAGLAVSAIASLFVLFDENASYGIKAVATAILSLTAAIMAFNIAKAMGAGPQGLLWATTIASTAAILFGAVVTGIDAVSDLKGYESGGMPDTGEIYIARENGSELVGRIGNHNAVMNNDQIVDSVSAGVYSAVTKALLANGGFNNSGGSGDVYLDGTKVGQTIAKSVFTEGVKAGYWNKK